MQQTQTPLPICGWFADLGSKERDRLVGAMITVTEGARSNTGLLIRVGNQAAYLLTPGQEEPVIYATNAVSFQRLVHLPVLPGLAYALDRRRQFDEEIAEISEPAGDQAAQLEHDDARATYEHDVFDLHAHLLREITQHLFSQHEAAATAA